MEPGQKRRSARRTVGAIVAIALGAVACGGEDAEPAGVRGPAGGRLHTTDGGPGAPRDDGGPRDAGFPRDAGGPRDGGTDAGGSGEASCRGVPTSCGALSEAECREATSCTLDEDCSGFATSCYDLFNRFECDGQDGCYWSTTFDDCAGSARPCSLYRTRSSCTGQRGCRFEARCGGTTPTCRSLAEWACERHPGCTWGP